MKRFLKILICVSLILMMSVMLTACGNDDETTTGAPPREYTAEETADILNSYFAMLGEAVASDDEDNGSFEASFDDISFENIVSNGIEGVEYGKVYMKDGLTYMTTPEGDVYIEKAYDGYIASISTVDGITLAEVIPNYTEEETDLFMDFSKLTFDADSMEWESSTKNLFTTEGDSVAAVINMMAGEDIYTSSMTEGMVMTIDMASYEKSGVICLYVDAPGEGDDDTLVITLDVSKYKNEKGTVSVELEAEDIKLSFSFTAGDHNYEKLLYVTEITEGKNTLTVSVLEEYKGDNYTLPSGASHSECDALIYEVSVEENEESLLTVKLNAANIGDTLRGYIDMFVGEDAPDLGGVGLLADSSELRIEGTFDIVLDGDDIKSAVAEIEMDYSLISGDVSIEYNADYAKQAGKTPLSISVSNKGATECIKIKTVSYAVGQGYYTFEYKEGNNSVTADAAIPAIKDFELTDRENYYLGRADDQLSDSKKTNEELIDLAAGAEIYVRKCMESGGTIQSYVLSKSSDGKRYYLTYFYQYGTAVRYEILHVLDNERAEYLYISNTGPLAAYRIEGYAPVEEDIQHYYDLRAEAIRRTEGIYGYPVSSGYYYIGFYKEQYDLYVYFASYNESQYIVSETPMDEDDLGMAVHMLDDTDTDLNIFDIHSLEISYSQDCYVLYTCTDCGEGYRSEDYDHDENSITIRELSDTDAGAEYICCERCGEAYLRLTDSQGNKIIFGIEPLEQSSANRYGIEGDISDMVVIDKYVKYEGEDGEFDRALNIPSITEKTGLTIVGMHSASYYGHMKGIDVILPEGFIYIEQRSFMFDITSLTLPSTLRYFAGEVFYYDPTFTELTIPENVEVFGSNSFPYLEKLTVNAKNPKTLYIPKMKIYDIDFNCESIDALYYRAEMNLETIVIPDGTKSFYGISGNRYVKKVVVPYSIESFARDAFEYCLYLEEAVLPDNMTVIGADLFEGCEALTTVKVILEDGTVIGNDNEVLIPRSATAVGGFYNCKSITKVILPQGITLISAEAFSGCTELSYIRMPSDLETVGYNAFYNCTKLGEECFDFGDKLKSVGNYAFHGTGIKELTLYAEAGVSNFTYLSLSGANIDHLIIKGQLNDLKKLYYEADQINIKEITIENPVRFGGTYGTNGTETVNIKYTEKTDYQYAVYTIPENVATVNFIGTEEQFKDLEFVVDGQFTVINYNVVFE